MTQESPMTDPSAAAGPAVPPGEVWLLDTLSEQLFRAAGQGLGLSAEEVLVLAGRLGLGTPPLPALSAGQAVTELPGPVAAAVSAGLAARGLLVAAADDEALVVSAELEPPLRALLDGAACLHVSSTAPDQGLSLVGMSDEFVVELAEVAPGRFLLRPQSRERLLGRYAAALGLEPGPGGTASAPDDQAPDDQAPDDQAPDDQASAEPPPPRSLSLADLREALARGDTGADPALAAGAGPEDLLGAARSALIVRGLRRIGEERDVLELILLDCGAAGVHRLAPDPGDVHVTATRCTAEQVVDLLREAVSPPGPG